MTMDILVNFEAYLGEWCEKNHKTNPGVEKVNDVWKLAWDSYLREVLKDRWNEYKEQYLSLELLKRKDLEKVTKPEKTEELEEEEVSIWERVSKLREQK